MLRRSCLALACAFALVVACDAPSVPAFTLRDSAGVEIADSREPAWPPGGAWMIAPESMLRIGVVEGDPRYQFSGLTGAARLSDGTVVVADGGSQEVRFFDGDGVFLRSVGRPGGGPGEFTGLSALGHGVGDTVWAYDFSLRRITWLDDRGDIARLTTLEPDPPILNPVGALADGGLVLKQLWGAQRVAEATVTGLRRDPVAYVRFDAHGALLDTLGLFPGREVYITSEGGRGVMSTPPFARNSTGAIRDGGVVVGSQSAFELEEYGPAGRLRRLMRIQGRDLVLRPGDLDRFIEDRAEAVPPEQRPRLRTELASMPVPKARPAYGELLADHSGNLWIAEWAPFPSLPGSWTVLAPDGRWLGDVAMPPDFYPWDIGEDWILGLERDEFDVEYLVLRAILKGGT